MVLCYGNLISELIFTFCIPIASLSRVRPSLGRSDSLELVDYFRNSGPIENFDGNDVDDDIDAYEKGYFTSQVNTDK